MLILAITRKSFGGKTQDTEDVNPICWRQDTNWFRILNEALISVALPNTGESWTGGPLFHSFTQQFKHLVQSAPGPETEDMEMKELALSSMQINPVGSARREWTWAPRGGDREGPFQWQGYTHPAAPGSL